MATSTHWRVALPSATASVTHATTTKPRGQTGSMIDASRQTRLSSHVPSMSTTIAAVAASSTDPVIVRRVPAWSEELERLGAREARRDVGPVHDLPERLDPVRLHVPVLQVVGVLPHVEHEQRRRALPDVALVVVDLLDDEALAERLPRERAPARALHRERGLGELAAEVIEPAEAVGDRGLELALGLAAAVGGEVLPEHGVQDVAGEVERE